MTEADQARYHAGLKLGEGNFTAATKLARQYLELTGAAAPVVGHALIELDDLVRESGVSVGPRIDDGVVTPTAQLLVGLPQHAQWAAAYQPPPLRLFQLGPCTAVCPNLLLTAGGKLINDNIGYNNAELCAHLPPEFPGIASSHKHIVLAVRHRDTARVKEPALYLPATTNYAAWLFGSLPRLAAYARQPELAQLPIVLHGDAKPYQLASLAMMGVPRERLIMHGAQVRLECRALHYCSTSYLHHAPSVTGILHVRDHVARAVAGAAGASGPKRLYLARRKARDRPLLNENEVIALFERHGFTAIDPEDHGFEEQARFAAGAEIIAGAYGANLANLVFAHRARKCLILATKQQPEFARLAGALNIACWHVVPDAIKLREGRTISESYGFSANLDHTGAALQACLAGET